MDIQVSKHAIRRYRQRMFDYNSPADKIRGILKEIALFGKRVASKPAATDDCFEVMYKGISIVLAQKEARCIVITCLGELAYRKWIKNQEQNVIHGRLRHELMAV